MVNWLCIDFRKPAYIHTQYWFLMEMSPSNFSTDKPDADLVNIRIKHRQTEKHEITTTKY